MLGPTWVGAAQVQCLHWPRPHELQPASGPPRVACAPSYDDRSWDETVNGAVCWIVQTMALGSVHAWRVNEARAPTWCSVPRYGGFARPSQHGSTTWRVNTNTRPALPIAELLLRYSTHAQDERGTLPSRGPCWAPRGSAGWGIATTPSMMAAG